MPEHQRTSEELNESLDEQLYFLDSSISAFSSNESEAKRVSLTVRVLLHDTRHSKSLLSMLGIKESLKLINSASPNDGRLYAMTNMRSVRSNSIPQYLGLIAKINCNGDLLSTPLFKQNSPEWQNRYNSLSFHEWWRMEVINIEGISLNRSDIILLLSNKDGGAHIDEYIPSGYFNAKTTKLVLNIRGQNTEFDGNIIYISAAQIGWELLKSLKSH